MASWATLLICVLTVGGLGIANAIKPALLPICSDSNETGKPLQCDRMEGKSVPEMLADSGYEMTMVSAGEVDQSKVDHVETVPATTTVELYVGKATARVAVALRLPVPDLLGRDICDPGPKGGYGSRQRPRGGG